MTHSCNYNGLDIFDKDSKGMIPSINRAFDAVLITTQRNDVTYAIVYATDYGRMAEFEDTFKNILASVKFTGTENSSKGMTPTVLSNSTLSLKDDTAILTILEGASVQGSPNYKPDSLIVKKGDKITVTNKDTLPHTVTSGTGPQDPSSGKLFDTSIIEGGDSFDIATTNIYAGNHPFHCTIHPYMTGTLIVNAH